MGESDEEDREKNSRYVNRREVPFPDEQINAEPAPGIAGSCHADRFWP